MKGLADWFLRWFCLPSCYDDIQGDLDELYLRESQGDKRGLKLKHTLRVVGLFRPDLIRPDLLGRLLPSRGMLRLHVVSSVRNIKRNRSFALTNIVGLSIGFAACLVVHSYVAFQSSYDQDHPESDRLYRVNQTAIWNPEGGMMGSTPPPLAEAMRAHFKIVEDATRINTPGGQLVRRETPSGEVIAFDERDVLAADSNFFEFFELPLQVGDQFQALRGPDKVVLSAEAASRYFGNQDPLGEILLFGKDKRPIQVSGVAEPQPDNRHFHFDFLWSMQTNRNIDRFDWSYIWTQVATYVRLEQGANPLDLDADIPSFTSQYVEPSFSKLGTELSAFLAGKGDWTLALQPVVDIHLGSADTGNRVGPVADGESIRLLRYVVFLILLIALVNYINMATARASTRGKEMSVKRVIGATQSQMLAQIMIESIVVVLLAFAVALPLAYCLSLIVQALIDIEIDVLGLTSAKDLLYYFGFAVLAGCMAGIYPAYQFASASGGKSIVSRQRVDHKALVRKGLVVIQFAIAISLMSGSLLLHRQLTYVQEKNLGFDQEQLLIINNAEYLEGDLSSFTNQVKHLPGVQEVALGMSVPGRGSWEDIYHREGSEIELSISQLKIDEDYIDLLDFELIEGRNFRRDQPDDLNGLIINETTARMFNWGESPIGKHIIYPGYPHELTVIGVVKDFHFQSLRQPLGPLMFFHVDSDMWGDQRVVCLRYAPSQEEQLLAELDETWSTMVPEVPLMYSFFDDEISQQYSDDDQLASLLTMFTGFSIFLAILGLVGLLAYSVQQRRKEISVRKVLGATTWELYLMLNKQYVILFVVALALAVPLSWRAMQRWLETFAYHITLTLNVFVVSTLVVIVLMALSVVYQSIRAAHVDVAGELQE